MAILFEKLTIYMIECVSLTSNTHKNVRICGPCVCFLKISVLPFFLFLFLEVYFFFFKKDILLVFLFCLVVMSLKQKLFVNCEKLSQIHNFLISLIQSQKA